MPFPPPSAGSRGEAATASVELGRVPSAEAQPGETVLTSSNKIDKSRNVLQVYQRLSPLPLASSGEAVPEAAKVVPEAEPASSRVVVEEGLQALVRHQLELLATPVLRWEGEAWSGLFVVLALALPQLEGRAGAHEGAGGQEGGEEDEQEWRAELGLDVAGLGALSVSLALRERALALRLSAADGGARARLEEGLEALRSRLEAFGFDTLELAVDSVAEETGEGRGADSDGR
nr:flagellar hook-length control protein FliK [Thauera aromatica]